jgi:hypothetical protein
VVLLQVPASQPCVLLQRWAHCFDPWFTQSKPSAQSFASVHVPPTPTFPVTAQKGLPPPKE